MAVTPIERARRSKRKKRPIEGQQIEIDAARRFVDDFGDRLRYAAGIGWLVSAGTHWTQDDREQVREDAKTLAEAMRSEAAALGDDETWKLAKRVGSSKGVTAVLDLARSDPRIRVSADELDTRRHLLACSSGTIDLKTGKLHESRPADLITHCVPHAFDPTATCPRWEHFVSEVMAGRNDLVSFLRRWAGYCLTGHVSEHALVMAVGGGANGKSVFVETLRHVMGDGLAVTAPPGLLLASKGERHPTELMRLRGKRVAIANEVPKAASFNEERVKSLTGGDTLSGRGMRQDFVDFPPTHKLVLCANDRPRVKDASEGFWRRMRVVPFDVSFRGREDRTLPERLRAEAPGILAWCVRGAVEWYEHGLGEPVEVQAATSDYRHSEDVFGRWLEDWIAEHAVDQPSYVTSAELSAHHKAWAEHEGCRPMAGRTLADALKGRGWAQTRSKSARGWQVPVWTVEPSPVSPLLPFEHDKKRNDSHGGDG